MSWTNFEELKKFARKKENAKKKRPASSVGWQNTSARKRRQTSNESHSFLSNIESTSEIEGFSTDEEGELLDGESHSTSRYLSEPCVKRKYSSKRRTLSHNRNITVDDAGCSHTNTTRKEKELQNGKKSELMPDGAYELLQCPEETQQDEIDWCASDDEELQRSVFSGGPESDDTQDSEVKPPSKHPTSKLDRGKSLTKRISNSIQLSENSASAEVISDFQSDQESSQESLSADISTPTPTPVSPVVVGTPKTASEWLKQVQQKSPQNSEEQQSPEGRRVSINCDSAKKKRKFIRTGLAEQLQHIISREKSEKSFWNHRVTETGKKQTGMSLQMSGCVVVQILSDQLHGSLHLTQCLLNNDDTPDPNTHKLVFVLFTCDTWNQVAMHVGAVVNIHPPWQKLDIAGCPWPVLLCTYYCEKHQSLEVHLPSVKGGPFIPFMHKIPSSSSLVQSPKKGFKPSKLFFGNDDQDEQKNMVPTQSLTRVQPTWEDNSKPDTSILNAIESCGGYSGALVTFQCLVQRVYCKKVQLAGDNRKNYRCSLLNQDLKSMARSLTEDDSEEIRWSLLVQDIHGMCAEIQVPQKFQDSADWHSCLVKGEGKVYAFSNLRVVQRTNKTRSVGLFSLIQSLWPSNDDDTAVSGDNGSSHIATQESESQATNSTSPPNFCYILTLQESSHVCQDMDSEGFVYKPYSFKTLWDVLHDKHGAEPQQRISTLGKVLYCRITGSSSMDCSFELFLTDSSLQNARGADELLHYVKVVGKSCHVLPPELRQAQTNYPIILSAKHLFLNVQAGSHELVADTYSVIRKAVPQSTTLHHSSIHDEYVEQDILEKLTSSKPVCLPSLTLHSILGYIYLVEGIVIGVDEETACCWLVCDTCGNRDITVQHSPSSQFFCSSCNRAVESPETRTHLAVFVKVKNFPDACIKVTLEQSTTDKLLPVSYQDSDQGYDIEAMLGKQLGSMSCYLTERRDSLINFNLEQIQIH